MGISRRSIDASTSNQIIIGVVVGSVVFIAITAGIILFFHLRRKREIRPRKYDQQLLPLQIPPAYKTNSFYPRSVSFDASRPRPSDTYSYVQEPPREVEQPPAYQASLPAYDPSKYQRVERPLSTVEISQNNLGPSPLNPVHYPDMRRSFQPLAVDNRFSFQRSTESETLERQSTIRGPSFDWTRTSQNDTTTSTQELQPPPVDPTSTDRPRRPKPVLSLITNL